MKKRKCVSRDPVVLKALFAEQFPVYSEDCAVRYAIQAAVTRNPTYTPGIDREEVRLFWAELLKEKIGNYRNPSTATKENFLKDVEDIKRKMNDKFPGAFICGKKGYSNNFRISHAQKSLSICLKHLWCNDMINTIPPVCPIDSIVLRELGCGDAWTKVDTTEEYKSHLSLVSSAAAAKGVSIAEWELLVFNNR